jgi:membrane protease YdiL (CAAX protease family)
LRRQFLVLLGSLGLLALTPINTSIEPGHFLVMGALLLLAVTLPYLVLRYRYHDSTIAYQLHHGRRWSRMEIGYILLAALIGYLVIPFYLVSSGSYQNWTVEPGAMNLLLLFVGTNALGIWDELFFVNTALTIFRRHIPFGWANLAQALLFTAFLYELGFRGWGPLMIFPFALLQGYVFKRTESLLYVIAIHLTVDLVLYLALIHAHHPSWLPIFIT